MYSRALSVPFLVAFAVTAAAQATKPPPTEFAGVAWTAKVDDARKVMDGMAATHKTKENPGYLLYEGGTLAGQTIGYISFEFAASGLHRGAVTFRPATDREKQFRELHDLLVAKYGPPTSSKRTENLPQLSWRFPGTSVRPESYTITCEMNRESRLGLTTKLIYVREDSPDSGKAAKSKGL
jgi:hypothetical protein